MAELSDEIHKIKETFETSMEELRQKREELALQVKLGSMEAREDWEALEHKMRDLETKWHQFQSKAGLHESAENLGAAMKILGTELKNGYQRLKGAL